MTDKIFIDSNVWCYLFIKDEYEKYKIAEKYFGYFKGIERSNVMRHRG
jgi:predicted nucleic acid-binding protein